MRPFSTLASIGQFLAPNVLPSSVLQSSHPWRPQSHYSRTLATASPNMIPSRSSCQREHAHEKCQDSEYATDQYFNIRCNPLLSTLPSRRPDRCSTHLPPAPFCSSRRSRSARYFYTALGWRCPLHPTPLPHTPGSGARGCSSLT